jgi:hypothetical protein
VQSGDIRLLSYCKYCAALDDHSGTNCPYTNVPEEFKCCNCKNEIGHHAGERFECPAFIEFAFRACEKEKIEAEKRYLEAKS